MLIYNVTVKVALNIVDKWKQWMIDIHLPEMMKTGKFNSYRMCTLEQVTDEDDATTFVVQYECNSLADYESYIAEYADAMRQDGINRFGNQFIAFRTIMEVVAKS